MILLSKILRNIIVFDRLRQRVLYRLRQGVIVINQDKLCLSIG